MSPTLDPSKCRPYAGGVIGLLVTYDLTGEPKYLDATIRAVELPYLGHAGGVRKGCDHSDGCGVSDSLRSKAAET